MQFSSALLESAVNEFAKLPGIGRKTALRLVLHLLKQEEEEVGHFSEVISRMRNEIKFCQRCHNAAHAVGKDHNTKIFFRHQYCAAIHTFVSTTMVNHLTAFVVAYKPTQTCCIKVCGRCKLFGSFRHRQ